jgi:polyhydroxyalkanoate synthesis regulator phasin
MAQKSANGMKVPEFLREPIEAAQARLAEFEEEAQKVFKDLMKKGKDSRKDIADLVQRLSKQDWRMEELKGHVSKLRAQGRERAQELRGRAESFRADAMERLEDLQTKAVAFLGVATREQVEALSRELERLSRRLDKAERTTKKPRKAGKRPAAEV